MDADNFSKKIDQACHTIDLMDMVDEAIIKTRFHSRARRFVESLIRQREIILNHRAGHKNPCQMYKAIDRLRINLEATGNKNAAMARYFIIYEEEIRSLIPGSSPNKQFEQFINLRDQAREINTVKR